MSPITARRVQVSLRAAFLIALAPVAAGAASQGEPVVRQKAHFGLAPKVQAILDAGGGQAQRLSDFMKYATNLVDNVDALDESVAPDVKLHDVEPQGF